MIELYAIGAMLTMVLVVRVAWNSDRLLDFPSWAIAVGVPAIGLVWPLWCALVVAMFLVEVARE